MSTNNLVPMFVAALIGGSILVHSWSAEARPPSAVPGEEAYQTRMSDVVTGNGGSALGLDPIPADRRLVIELVNVTMIVQPGQKPSAFIYGAVMRTALPFRVPLVLEESGTHGDIYRGNQSLRLYVDGDGQYGPQLYCTVDIAVGTPVGCSGYVSGYLVGK